MPDDSYWLSMGDDHGGGGGGNGQRSGRRRGDQPSRFDKAVKKGVQKAPGGGEGCMLQAIGLFGLALFAAGMTADALVKRLR